MVNSMASAIAIKVGGSCEENVMRANRVNMLSVF